MKMGASGIKYSCLAALFLAMSLLGQHSYVTGEYSKAFPKPSDCFILECPLYDVVETHSDFEIRSYHNVSWVSSPPISSPSFKQATDIGFNILFAYIYGKNDKRKIISMSAPVLVDITPLLPNSKNSSYITYFYLPKKFQNKAPKANNVVPIILPKNKYAVVRRFSGFLSDKNIHVEVVALKKSLKGTAYESATRSMTYTVAGYNSPFELVLRVNEVMFWFDNI